MDVDICNNCDYLQSISEKHDGCCTRCDGEDFHQEKRKVLMLDIPKYRNSLTDNRIIYPKNTKHIQSFFNQLPPRVMISKMRDYGLPLDSFDLPDYVLDPKIGVALMPELVTEMTSLSEITLVQGAAIAANTIPYSSILTPELNHNYALLPKIPKMTLDQARDFGLSFVGRHLPFILMEHNENMTPTQLEKARQDYSKIINKIDTVVFGLQPEEGPVMHFNLEEHQLISEILKDFENYQIYEGRKKLNLFFKYQGRRYSEKVNDKAGSLNSSDAKTLEEIVNLFYIK